VGNSQTVNTVSDTVSDSVSENFSRCARLATALPQPGSGETQKRFAALRSIASQNPSLGRLMEAHEDAVAILAEAGSERPVNVTMGVWASSASATKVLLKATPDGEFVLSGRTAFCGGAAFVDASLVLAEFQALSDDENARSEQLVLLSMNQTGVVVEEDSWPSTVFAEAGIRSVSFQNVHVGANQLVGPPGFYGSRPGFWHGAMGVAALWAGMADALVAMRKPEVGSDQISRVRDGRIHALVWSVTAALEHGARRIDENPHSTSGSDAIFARHHIYEAVKTIVGLVQDEAGPRRLAFDEELNQQIQSIELAIRQCHGDGDLLLL
jgi:hypothetical protein